MSYTYTQLSANDTSLVKKLLTVFGGAFEDSATYLKNIPPESYLETILGKSHVIALVARFEDVVVGGIVAYELDKLEQARREIYIYDLAVSETHRRKGVATGLIRELQRIAKKRNAYVIYAEADEGDNAATRLYESLGTKESVYHFDIPPLS